MYTANNYDPSQLRRRRFQLASVMLASFALCIPLGAARADDDYWEDRWEDYQERLEDRREEAEERWEDEQEAYEDWRENRRDAWEDRHQRQIIVPRHGRRNYYREHSYWEPLPPPQHYRDRGPVNQEYYVEEPPRYREHRYYRPYGPEYRYYGTGDVGYTEYGRERSVQVGPFKVYWRR